MMFAIKVIRKSRIDDTFSYYGYERQVGDGTVLVQSGFLDRFLDITYLTKQIS